MYDIIEQLRDALPPVFLGTASSELTGGVIHWPTIQNKRALREIPDECFVRSGPRVLVIRDPFLNWWATTLRPARQPPLATARSRGRPRKQAAETSEPSAPLAAQGSGK